MPPRPSAVPHPSPSLDPDALATLLAAERAESDALRRHPAFPALAFTAARSLSAQYRGNVVLTRILNDRGRIALGLLMLGMHLESAPGSPGLTAGRLKAEATGLRLCSPGRVTALIAACRLLGLLAPVPDTDRRRQRLAVTPRMLAIHTARWRTVLEAMAPIAPEGARASRHLDDPRFLEPFVDTMLAPFRAGWRLVDDMPRLQLFTDHDGGLMVAFALFDAARTGAALSLAQLARDGRISRSHVMEMLRAAAASGLVRREVGRGAIEGGVLAEPPLVEAMQMVLAAAMARLSRASRAGLAAIGEAAPGVP